MFRLSRKSGETGLGRSERKTVIDVEVDVVLLSVGIRLRIRPQPPALSNTKIKLLAGT